MAHIRERLRRGNPCFRVDIRITGYPAKSRTFDYREDAERWAQDTEATMRKGAQLHLIEMPQKCGVYIIWRHKTCLYVGSSVANIMERIAVWCASYATHYSIIPCDPEELYATEYRMISAYKPVRNKLGRFNAVAESNATD